MARKDSRQIFNSIASASTALRQARITLYAVDPLGVADAGGIRTTYYEEYLKGVSSPSRAVPADLSLQVLAIQSGGRVAELEQRPHNRNRKLRCRCRCFLRPFIQRQPSS